MLAGLDVHTAKPATKFLAPHLVALARRCPGVNSHQSLGLRNIAHGMPSEVAAFRPTAYRARYRVATVLAFVATVQDSIPEIHEVQRWFRSAVYSRKGAGK